MAIDKKAAGVLNQFMTNLEKISDQVVSGFYDENLVKKVEELDFMKKLVASGFVQKLIDFGKGWFKQVFVILGYIAIVVGIIYSIAAIVHVIDALSFHWYAVLRFLVETVMYLVTILVGVAMVKFKKWYPFITIVYMIVALVYQLIIAFYPKMVFSSIPYMNQANIGVDFVSMIVTIAIMLAVRVIFFAVVLKNKKLFVN